MLGAAGKLLEQGGVLRAVIHALIVQAGMLQCGGSKGGVFLSTWDVLVFEKQAGAIWKGKPATQSLLQSYVSSCMLLKPIDCSPGTVWEENTRKWGKKMAVLGSMFQRLPLGMDRFKSCDVQDLILATFKSHKACLVWLGEGGSLLIFFRNNKTFQRGCSSRCSMLDASHMRSKTGFAVLLFNLNCWPRACKSSSRCLFLENSLSAARVVSRACLWTSILTVLDPLGCIIFPAVVSSRYHRKGRSTKQTRTNASLERSPTSGDNLFVLYSP